MKKTEKSTQIVKIFFRGVAILTLLVGLFFSAMGAHFEDAPGLVIIGGTMSLAMATVIFGIGEIIILLKKD